MIRAMAEKWWTFVLRGVVAILFGILVIKDPALAVTLLMLFIGAFWVVDGLLELFGVMGSEGNKLWGLLYAFVTIIAGVFMMTRPELTAVALALVIGLWAIIKGISEIAIAIRLRKEITGEFFLILSGVVSVLFGLFVVFRGGVMAILMIIAIFAIVEGILAILLGFKLKGLKGAEGA